MTLEHPQFGEAIDRLREEFSFAIVDPIKTGGCEIRVNANERFECTIESTSKDEPSIELRSKAEARGFSVEKVVDQFRFGPDTGKEFTFYRISRGSMDPETAIREAIKLFLIVSRLTPSEWMWITAENYAERGTPERPSVWPPAET